MNRSAHALLVRLLLGLALLAMAGCVRADPVDAAEAGGDGEAPTTVILISMDGTRPADLTEERLPALLALAREGARAERLVPVDPTNTFPSHVSLATGVRPEKHRLVNNRFHDPLRGRFSRDAPHTWIESEPIWSIAERHDVPSASYYWVGSEGPWQGGPGPRETRRFSSRTSEKRKVTQILAWLDEADPARRPRLITSWFHGADHAGHVSGPDSPEVTRQLAPQDRQIARLVRELEARDLFASTTLLIVSDHGMALASERVNLGVLLDRAGVEAAVLGIGGFATIVFEDDERSEAAIARAVAVAREAGLEASRRTRAPADWHVGDPRFGDVVVRAPVGVAIVTRTTLIDGFHGYPGTAPEMGAVLVARGRGVRVGASLGVVSALQIAPTVLRLLDLPVPAQMTAPPIDGLLDGIGRPDDAPKAERPRAAKGSGPSVPIGREAR